MKISATLKNPDPKAVVAAAEVEKNFGANLQELVALVGEEVAFNKAVDSLVIDCQSNMRRMIRAGKTQAEIEAAIAAWVPSSTSTVRRSPSEKIADLAAKMTPEEKKALLKQLKEQTA